MQKVIRIYVQDTKSKAEEWQRLFEDLFAEVAVDTEAVRS